MRAMGRHLETGATTTLLEDEVKEICTSVGDSDIEEITTVTMGYVAVL